MKNFRDIISHTKDINEIITEKNENIIEEFKNIVNKLGGTEEAKKLLFLIEGKNIQEAKKQTPQAFLRDLGYKIKSEDPFENGFELEMFSKSSANNAFEDLKTAGFGDKYDLDLFNKNIYIEEK